VILPLTSGLFPRHSRMRVQPRRFAPPRSFPRLLLAVLAAAGFLAAGVRAAGDWRLSPRDIREEVKSVVADQLRAFQREDIPAAYAFASSGIKQQFRLPVYERMIRRGYAPLLKHVRAEPGVVRDDGGAMAMLPVVVHGDDGQTSRFRYHLLREDGQWRVSGVMPEGDAPKGET